MIEEKRKNKAEKYRKQEQNGFLVERLVIALHLSRRNCFLVLRDDKSLLLLNFFVLFFAFGSCSFLSTRILFILLRHL